MARKAGELKKRCWLAKQRLKMGYWDSLKKVGNETEEPGERIAAQYASARLYGGIAEIAAVSATDEKMYRKVCEILDSNEVAMNPIGQLIERDVYDSLDPSGKQRYVLELSEKFRQLKERYYREKTGS